jgi:raffinose/stachyose/melibiose transport system substrate-binding protein
MKKNAQIVFLIILSVVLIPGIFAAGGQDTAQAEEIVTLRIYAQYSNDSEKFPYDYAEKALAIEMPNVKLELDIISDVPETRLRTYAAAGNLPDIFQAASSIITQFIESGDIAQLDKYVAEAGVINFLSDATKPSYYHEDGHTYAIPREGQYASAIFYNKDLFKEHGIKVPENFEEMIMAFKALTENDVIPIALFAKNGFPGVQLFDMLLTREMPGGLLNIDAGINKVTEEAFKKAAVKLKQLVDEGLMYRGAFNTEYDEALALFTQGQAAMLVNGMWAVKDLGEMMGDSVDILPSYYPLADAGKEAQAEWHMSGGTVIHDGFSVNSGSENLELASRVAVFFGRKYAEGKTVGYGYPPLYTDTPEIELKLSAIHNKALTDSSKYKSTSAFPWQITNPELAIVIEDSVNSILAGKISPEEFVLEIEKVTN